MPKNSMLPMTVFPADYVKSFVPLKISTWQMGNPNGETNVHIAWPVSAAVPKKRSNMVGIAGGFPDTPVQNEPGSAVAAFSHLFDRASGRLGRVVFGRRKSIEKNFPYIERISHIGSTAIPAIWAKPIIDILVEAPKGTGLGDYKDSIIKMI